MARGAFGRQVVRGTICRDTFRAEVTLTCSDAARVGQLEPLLVQLRWRTGDPAPDSPGTGPADARIALAFARRFDAATGDLRFGALDGPTSVAVPTASGRQLLRIAAAAATAGTEPDVLLQVSIDGEVSGGLPLSATSGTPADPAALAIRAADGTADPPDAVVDGRSLTLRAVPAPAAEGNYEWFGVPADVLEVTAPPGGAPDRVDVVGHRAAGVSGSVCVLFTPAGGGPAVLAEHRLAVDPDPGAASFTGRVVDQLDRPVPGAVVELRSHSGALIAGGTSGADGGFAVPGPPRSCVIAVRRDGATAWSAVEVPAGAPPAGVVAGTVRIRLPVTLAGSVGDGGDNRPDDVTQVAERLVRLGRLSPADRTAEAAAPGPRTLAAIYAHHRAAIGTRLPLVNGDTVALLNGHPPVRPAPIPLTGPVGALPGARVPMPRNLVAEVHAVQDRLAQLSLLPAADLAADRAAEPAGTAPLPDAALTGTAAAARRLDLRMAGGALRAVVPDRPVHRLLGDPMWFGRLPLHLTGSVGVGGENAPADVRAVVTRLGDLGLLDAAAVTREVPPTPDAGTDRVDESTFPGAVSALVQLRQARLGVTAPAAGLVEPADPALAALNAPPRSDVAAPVGLREGGQPAANLPADVRAVQDRLLLVGFLSEPDWHAERVAPGRPASPPVADLVRTLAALRTFQLQVLAPADPAAAGGAPPDPALPFAVGPGDLPPALTLTGGVGDGQPNAAADVRAVQDRLAALRFLAPADHDRERADPAGAPVAGSAVPATLAAITALRRRVFGRPPPGSPASAWSARPLVLPGDETARFLADPLFSGRLPVRLAGSVGALGWNHPQDVRAVADRLVDLGILAAADAARVDATGLAPLEDAAIAAVVAAIGVLRRDFLAETGPPSRIEAAGPLVRLLGNPWVRFADPDDDTDPRCGLTSRIDPVGSVGAGGANRPADVRAVQDRLRDLRLLAATDHAAEAADPAGAAAVADTAIPRTLAALDAFQRLLVPAAGRPAVEYRGFQPAGHPVAGRLEPLDETLRMLDRPYRPPTAPLLLTSSVGSGTAANRGDDVRRVQDRLHLLGYLDSADYLAPTRPPATGGAGVPAAAMAATVAAIGLSQRLAGGFARDRTGHLDPLGHGHRALQDPSWSTPTVPNPNADYEHAGPAAPGDPSPAVAQEIADIITVIEAQESGRGTVGETASDLHTAARTPASYGRVQTIGALTAETLRAADLGAFYTPGAPLVAVVTASQALLRSVAALVPAGATDAQALAAAATYSSAAQLATVRGTCGFDAGDILNAFRLGFLLRRLDAAVQAARAATTVAAKRTAATAGVAAVLAAVQPAIDALGMPRSDLETMVAVNALNGENREGFNQRALWGGVTGQLVRNAETDGSGTTFGRYVIRNTYLRVRNAPGGAALTPRQRVVVTAHLHNHGGDVTALVAHPEAPATFDATYAEPVVRRWDTAHPGAVGVGTFPVRTPAPATGGTP